MPASEYFKKAIHSRDTSSYKVVSRGQLAYATIHLDEGSVGLLRSPQAGLISPMYTVLEASAIEPSYLLALLKTSSSLQLFKRIGQGSVNRRASITFDNLAKLFVCYPPLPEQRKIVAILSSIENTIDHTKAVIEQVKLTKQALLQKLMSQGISRHNSRFKETPIGPLPTEWTVNRLGDLCDSMFVGIAQAATYAYVQENGVPIIRTANIKKNEVSRDGMLQISEDFAIKMKSKALRTGDVLTARTGFPGTSAVVPPELDGAQCFTLLVSRVGSLLVAEFLAQMMNSQVGQQIVHAGQAGGAQQNLNVGVFRRALLPLPSVEEQRQIVRILQAVDERIRSEESLLDALYSVKAALLPALLSGRIRVEPGAPKL